MSHQSTLRKLLLGLLAGHALAGLVERQSWEPYAPYLSSCPSIPLLRQAIGLSAEEAAYVRTRKADASQALRDWLEGTELDFDTQTVPTLALASSGGGYRAMLTGAGVVQALDDDDSNSTVSGLYQALTYHSGLSGGAWLLSSMIGNEDYSTISELQGGLWSKALVNNSLYPLNTASAPEGLKIIVDVAAKWAAGYAPTITDIWGRFLSYQTLLGADGGVAKRLSAVSRASRFSSVDIPYPIITALAKTGGIEGAVCDPPDNGAQFELTPFEMGSWDQGIQSFTRTAYLGTNLTGGLPVGGKCYQGYDNLGYVLGTSSSKFQESCGASDVSIIGSFLKPFLPAGIINATLVAGVNAARRELYAPYVNPFYGSAGSPLVANDPELYLLDGGEANQNNPIWPFLQPYRSVDVVLVNDNSADTNDNWPNGTEILHTYEQAQLQGLPKMPFVPSVADFVSQGLNKRASFFGCYDPTKITIVFLPNQKWTYASNVPTGQFSYPVNETAAMISNGNAIATQGNDGEWPDCLACGIMHKTSKDLPKECGPCLQKYCVSQ